jgi:branched-chain amino acid transport system ATP-binding protein
MPGETQQLAELRHVRSGYESKPVLENFSLGLNAGDLIALIGPNGAGKSTALKVLFGLLPAWSGTVQIGDREVKRHNPSKALEAGMVYAPQVNRVFPCLTVRENLILGFPDGCSSTAAEGLEGALRVFPVLKGLLPRKAGNLSGGEQQMVSLGRCLVGRPRLLLLDEPSLGLSPQMNEQVLSFIAQLNAEGTCVVLVEQKVKLALRVARKIIGMKLGRIAFEATPAEISEDSRLLSQLFLQ